MDYTFIEQCRNIQRDRELEIKDKALDSLIDMLFRQKKRGKEKAMGLGEYDGESLIGSNMIIPGNIYAFQYRANSPVMYDNKRGIAFKFYDSLPILLVTKVSGKTF